MYTTDVPEYLIDLELPEKGRWSQVIARERGAAKRLAEEAMAEIPGWTQLLGGLFRGTYALAGGRWMGEMDAWAKSLGRSSGDLALLNCTYELSHAAEYVGSIFGCTAGVRWCPGLGMVHVRSMDWPLPSIGRATRVFRFQKGERAFVAVSMPGFVGVLSGMVPGRYSVTINWAPPVSRPTFDFGPAFLLRDVLETCDSYEDAVHSLKETVISASVFFTVCGRRRNEGCVIERTRTSAIVRKYRAPVLVQANHHVAAKFVSRNETMKAHDEHGLEYALSDSEARAEALAEALTAVPATKDLREVAASLDVESVCNEHSYQQMVFCPSTGDFAVWRNAP